LILLYLVGYQKRDEGSLQIILPTKLSTTVNKIRLLPNKENVKLVLKFHEFMKGNSTSERHQNNNLKAILSFSNYLGQ
jgi:hypothetical protein